MAEERTPLTFTWDMSRFADSMIEVGTAITEAMRDAVARMVEQIHALLPPQSYTLTPVARGTTIVRPAKGYSTWYGWRDGRWHAVKRFKGEGWVWLD